jgi:spore maturation protein CgeB
MKILLVANKTYRGSPDSIWWYFWEPLIKLGHEVYFYDTVGGDEEGSFAEIVMRFQPDLIFCILTGNKIITPKEPWDELLEITQKGIAKTFNWYCDDTWRFDNFSSISCGYFHVCSTPERSYLEKYKEIGYDNIILANWHANHEYYPVVPFKDKPIETSFIGAPNPSRDKFFKLADVEMEYFFGLTQEDLFNTFSNSKISINLSINNNDPDKKTQMKQRIFEIPAGAGLLVTEYHEGIEEYYDIKKEIVTFSTVQEFKEKMLFLKKNPDIVEKIASNGHKRFLKQNTSEKRLASVVEEIMKK